MAEYIERWVAIAKLTALEVTKSNSTMADVRRLLADMPTADVAQVVHGRWKPFGGRYYSRKKCSHCGWDGQEWVKFYKYCPNCGAKMDIKEQFDV